MVTGFVSGADGLNPAAALVRVRVAVYVGAPEVLVVRCGRLVPSVGIPVQSPKPATLGRLHQTDTDLRRISRGYVMKTEEGCWTAAGCVAVESRSALPGFYHHSFGGVPAVLVRMLRAVRRLRRLPLVMAAVR